MTEEDDDTGIVAKYSLVSHSLIWVRSFSLWIGSIGITYVQALALNPAQTQLVAFIDRPSDDENLGHNRRCFTKIDSADGRPLGRPICMNKIHSPSKD